ncbi:fimbrial protein [Enterobacter ludwigii]|jgi:type 1 fimbria pilin|nr:fimbrial protein [Enterobacter ludwigii]
MTTLQIYAAVVALTLTFFPSANGHDGTVNISGTIQDNTCEISPDSLNKTVAMGTVVASQFTLTGERSPAVPFSIHLQNCGPAASQVKATFSGKADAQNKDLFAIESVADAATGLALGLYNANGGRLPPDSASAGVALKPGQSSVTMDFSARYVSVSERVTAGVANVVATFELAYD